MDHTLIFKNIILPVKLATYLPWNSQLYLTNKILYRFRDQYYQTNLQTEIFKLIHHELKYELCNGYFDRFYQEIHVPYLNLNSTIDLKVDLQQYPFFYPSGPIGIRGMKGARGCLGYSGTETEGDEMIDSETGAKLYFRNGNWELEVGRCPSCYAIEDTCWCKIDPYGNDLYLACSQFTPKQYFGHQIYKYSAESFLNKLKNLNIYIKDDSSSGCIGPM